MDKPPVRAKVVIRANGKTTEGELIKLPPGSRKAQHLPEYVGCPIRTAARIRYVATITGIVVGVVAMVAGMVIGRFLLP